MSAPVNQIKFPPGHGIAGRYRIVDVVGFGASGVVYCAEDDYMTKRVALKFLRREPDDAELARLRQVIEIGQNVSNPCVCRTTDIGKTDHDATFISMEFIRGDDLKSVITQFDYVPKKRAARCARDLASGLAALHAMAIVHRDLKPANILLEKSGRTKITDLELAVPVGTSDVNIVGSLWYMAPEQMRGDPADLPADIYSLGLVLYELFTGKRCLNGETPQEVYPGYDNVPHMRPSVDGVDLDSSVDHLIMSCLERDPGKRPTARALRQFWEDFLTSL